MRTIAVLSAIVVVSLALSNTETMSIDNEVLLQEKVGTHAQAKVGLGESAKVAAKVAAKLGAGATMKIWGKEVSVEAINQAKKQLHKVVTKLSVKRPQMMSSISAIQEITAHPGDLGESKLNGGFKKLSKVLYKIDSLEQELLEEHARLSEQIRIEKAKCDKNWNNAEDQLKGKMKEYEGLKTATKAHKNGITEDKIGIQKSEDAETEVWGQRLEGSEEETKAAYDKYWLESDDRADVRNIMMQAVWLVCYGFRTFRHDDFCTTLRKEPDFAEGDAQGRAGGNTWKSNVQTSYAFSETMEKVWQQQKAADAHAVNAEDGDPDMEKGFVNNRAPWGVDNEGTGGDDKKAASLIQEAVGVDASDLQADGSMSSAAIASRLDFLLQSYNVPSKAATPIQDLIQAFQEDAEAETSSARRLLNNKHKTKKDPKNVQVGESKKAGAKQNKKNSKNVQLGESNKDGAKKSWWEDHQNKYKTDDLKKKTLVQIMVEIEKDQGVAQAAADIEWLDMVHETSMAQMADANGLVQETATQNSLQDSIRQHNNKVNEIAKVDISTKKGIDDLTIAMHDEMEICQVTWMELDLERESNEEEQVNIRRLNSLLRFLALGDDPSDKCSEPGEDETNACMKKQDRGTCTWYTRGTSEGGNGDSDDANRAFCACEWGYHGSNCQYMKCPGFGHTLYRSVGDPDAAGENGVQDGVCSNRGGDCDDTPCSNNGCDVNSGLCSKCSPKFHSIGAKVAKCQFRFCPMDHTNPTRSASFGGEEKYVLPTGSENIDKQCSMHGECDRRSGKCACEAEWWGDHCGWRKCPGAAASGGNQVAAKFPGWSASACNNRGECLTTEGSNGQLQGKCACDQNQNFGDACELHKCPGNCQDRGTCKAETGMCQCKSPYHGATCSGGEGTVKECFACTYTTCPFDCGGNGVCNKISGHCVCRAEPGDYSSGAKCSKPCSQHSYAADWTRSMDKWGWSTCEDGYLLTGIKRDGAGDALYNLAYGKCARPCEGTGDDRKNLGLEHCYHENWWKKFDYAGGKLCRKNYFVAGLFRSHCNSLYCLEMAKCCQIQRSLWNECSWVDIKSAFHESNCKEKAGVIECAWAEVPENTGSFVAGFYRSKVHTLDGLTYLRKCIPYFFGDKCRPGDDDDSC